MRLMKRLKPSDCPKYSTVLTLSKTPSAGAWLRCRAAESWIVLRAMRFGYASWGRRG